MWRMSVQRDRSCLLGGRVASEADDAVSGCRNFIKLAQVVIEYFSGKIVLNADVMSAP
jgi:hypothetical protein